MENLFFTADLTDTAWAKGDFLSSSSYWIQVDCWAFFESAYW